MNGQQFPILVNADLVSQAVHVERTPASPVRHAVVVAADGHEPFVADTPLEPDHAVKRSCGQRLQLGPFLAEALVEHAMRGAMHADIGDGVEPLAQLAVHVAEILETTGEEEVLADVTVRAFDLAFGLGAVSLASTWSKAVVLRECNQLCVVDDVLLNLTQHRCLHPVVENLTRCTANMLERFHMTTQHRLQILMLNEAAPEIAAVSKDNREQPD